MPKATDRLSGRTITVYRTTSTTYSGIKNNPKTVPLYQIADRPPFYTAERTFHTPDLKTKVNDDSFYDLCLTNKEL